ncbi:SPFH domain-containing protein [Gordonia aichiensis]|uniref:SPFH domain-containing protein n=1 Tax=Gordonia aichiensis TaxID=36820 RepID=UPI003263DD40
MEFRKAWRTNGFVGLVVALVVLLAAAAVTIGSIALVADGSSPALIVVTVLAVLIGVVALLAMTGLTVVSPNEAKVLQFFGRYVGSVSEAGFYLVTPLTDRRTISLRIRNFETQKLKVNDADGNPVEIAAVVVYRVVDSFKAAFAVDDYEEYVAIQSEAAVRHLATAYPYDSHETNTVSLRDGATIAEEMTVELRERTQMAGIEIIEARITHLAYAPEIAQAMLVRQQAAQVVAARQQIVEGAVGMVGLALDRLAEQGVVELDEERRAAMVSNLLVVLCGDRATQPVVNTGSLYA